MRATIGSSPADAASAATVASSATDTYQGAGWRESLGTGAMLADGPDTLLRVSGPSL